MRFRRESLLHLLLQGEQVPSPMVKAMSNQTFATEVQDQISTDILSNAFLEGMGQFAGLAVKRQWFILRLTSSAESQMVMMHRDGRRSMDWFVITLSPVVLSQLQHADCK